MVDIDYTKESAAYTKRIKQVYRHYTVNDCHTLGLNGFLKFLRDLNLLKKSIPETRHHFETSSTNPFETTQSSHNYHREIEPKSIKTLENDSEDDDGCIYIDRKNLGLDQISQPKASLLFT